MTYAVPVTERNAQTWSKIGSRATFGLAMAEIGKSAENLMVLTADTSTSAGLDRFKKAFPDKFLDVGIAEQNMMCIAAGLASEGLEVVTATFAPFQTMRCCEQIRVNLGYMKQKVVFVGLASGVALGTLGYTHCAVEDVAIMRSIPNIAVVSPADCSETAKAVAAALSYPSSVYIRLTGGKDNPVVYDRDYKFVIGRGITLREGADVALVAAGTMVHRALAAADRLAEKGLSATVVDMHTVQPIDGDLLDSLGRMSLVVTIEEHSLQGGLASAVAEHFATSLHRPRQLALGLPHAFGATGDYHDILAGYGLTPEAIAQSVIERLRQ